jgi:hypothetical protein
MAGLLDSIKDLAKQQYAKGAPYREAVSGLFQGDMNRVNQALSKSDLTPIDFAMMLGTIKGVGKAPLSALEQTILDKSGDYALQRFQKAKSLVPDLETQYTPKALQNLFTERDMYGLTVMKPSEFENFASPLSSNVENIQKYSRTGDTASFTWDEPYLSYVDYMKHLENVAKNTGFREVPYLHLNKTETGLPLNPFISGHEGRHRTRALTELGDYPTLVELRPRGDLYQSLPTNTSDYGLPINTQEQFVNALNKEMNYNNMIYPQPTYVGNKEIPRIPRKLPNEIFGAGLIPAGLLDEKKRK